MINLNVQTLTDKFSNLEQLGILCVLIESAYRYDFVAAAQRLNMQGRSYFAARNDWRTKDTLLDWILLPETEFNIKNKHYTPINTTLLDKKRCFLETTLQDVGINAWVSEFLKIYSISWVINRITNVISSTRPELKNAEIQYELNLSLEGVRVG